MAMQRKSIRSGELQDGEQVELKGDRRLSPGWSERTVKEREHSSQHEHGRSQMHLGGLATASAKEWTVAKKGCSWGTHGVKQLGWFEVTLVPHLRNFVDVVTLKQRMRVQMPKGLDEQGRNKRCPPTIRRSWC